ncbi:MAG: M48 family metallopeptidase [Planctomycetes bacterium]|nr:M48 family metallopeptidase [Planctomycetota bacterium]
MIPFHVRNILVLAVSLLVAPAAAAQQPRGAFPFADPQAFFNGLFGEETPEERRRLESVKISFEEEKRFGNAAARQYIEHLKQQGAEVTDRGRDVEYLRRLVETVRPQMEKARKYRRLTIYVVDSPTTDARTFPGGTLFFFRGMLDFCENEAALVGVVGHELSHLDRGHLLLPLRRSKFAQTAFGGQGAFSPEEFFASAGTMMRMFTRPFRPEDEAEADLDGATWTYRAGYDPREMGKLFLAMHRRDAGKGPDFMPAFLRTHPFHMDRFRAIEDRYEHLNRAEPAENLYIGAANLRRRIPRSERVFPE